MLLNSIIIIMDQLIFQTTSEWLAEFWHKFISWMNDHGYQIVLILILAEITRKFGSKIILKILEKTVRRDLYPTKTDRIKRIKTLESLISAVAKVAVFVIAAIMIMSELGLNTTPVVASAGVLGLALGFGAQSLIKDLTSGLFIITENQYRVGDIVQLDNGVSGKVVAITIRTTQIRTLDGTLYHIPNGTIQWTANKTMSYSGIDENIVFPNSVDIEKLAIVINRTGEELAKKPDFKDKIKTPPHFVRVVGFDPSGITIKITGKTGTEDAADVKGAFYSQLIKELKKSKIDTPYSHLVFVNPNLTKNQNKKLS